MSRKKVNEPESVSGEMQKEKEEILETDAAETETAGTTEDGRKESAEQEQTDPLREELEAAQAKTAEYLAMAQRIQADFENFRRRNESVRSDAYADGRRDVAAVMLPVLDNLERAVDAAGEGADESIKNGVALVLKQMNDIYAKLNVKPIDRLGEKFDPNLENAVLQGTEDDGDPGTVCQVLQKGYQMGDRVLRHAMVKVVPE